MLPSANAYADRYHVASPFLLPLVAEGLAFDRHSWRQLVSELLLFCALEIPEFPISADAWCRLLAPDLYQQHLAGVDPDDLTCDLGRRDNFAPIQQALWGSRDLTFGTAVYRPDHAGISMPEDVVRLHESLHRVEPASWIRTDLEGLRGIDPDDLEEELDDARAWFDEFRDFFQRTAQQGHLIVHEEIF